MLGRYLGSDEEKDISGPLLVEFRVIEINFVLGHVEGGCFGEYYPFRLRVPCRRGILLPAPSTFVGHYMAVSHRQRGGGPI